MGLFDRSKFAESIKGNMLRKIAMAGAKGAPPGELGFGARDQGALTELERMGYVEVHRGNGALAWRVERVVVTEKGLEALGEE